MAPPFIPARQAFWEAEQRKQGGGPNVPPLWKQASLVVEIRVFDETGQSALPVAWRFDDRWISPDKLLANISKQTSLSLTRQPHNADIWFMVDDAAGGSR